MPLPRLDVRAGRPAASRSAREAGAGLRARRHLLARARDRGLGAAPLRQPRPRRAAAGRDARRLPELVAGGGIEVERLRFRHRSESELACNWKIAIENYLECYHCPVAHPGFSAVVDVSPDAYRLERTSAARASSGRCGPGARAARSRGTVPLGSGRSPSSTRCQARRTLRSGPSPPGPERTSAFLDYYFAETERTRRDRGADRLRRPGRPRGSSARRVGPGAASARGCSSEGRLMPESERLLAHFQGLVREALA